MEDTMTDEAEYDACLASITPSRHWPESDHVDAACPHCKHVDSYQIAIARDMGMDCRDGECSECFGAYVIEAEEGQIQVRKGVRDAATFLIRHHYDIGDQAVAIRAPEGLDPRRAAIYMQFLAEEWFGDEKMLTNLGVAAALVAFYGCKHAARNPFGETIDMYFDREKLCGRAEQLMADESLMREGLRSFLAPHVEG